MESFLKQSIFYIFTQTLFLYKLHVKERRRRTEAKEKKIMFNKKRASTLLQLKNP